MLFNWLKNEKSQNNPKIYGQQLVNFDQLEAKLDSIDEFAQKIDILKEDYPAIYLAVCKQFKMETEQYEYINQCL